MQQVLVYPRGTNPVDKKAVPWHRVFMPLVIDTDSHFRPLDMFDDDEGRRRFRNRWQQIIVDATGRQMILYPDRARKAEQDQILGLNACELFGIDPETRQRRRTL